MSSSACFFPMVTEWSLYLLDLNRHWNNGRYLYGGGLIDQPGYYIEAMDFIDQHRNRLQIQAAKIDAERRRLLGGG